MSKRNKQQTMYQPSGQAKRRPVATKTNQRAPHNVANATRSSKKPAPPLPKVVNSWNLSVIRIAAGIIAVVAVVGGIAWASSIQASVGSFTPIQLVGLVALGFTAGLAIAVAFRTDEVVRRVIALRKERERR